MHNGDRLSTSDACFFYSDSSKCVFEGNALTIYDGAVDFDRVVRDIDAKLDGLPRLMQRLVPVPLNIAHPSWEFDPDFDIRHHVRRVELPAPGTAQQLHETVVRLMQERLERDRPLWRLYVIEGLEHARSASLNIVHHSVSDGTGMQAFAEVLNDLEPNPPLPEPGPRDFPAVPGAGKRLIRGIRDNARDTLRHLSMVPGVIAGAPKVIFTRNLWDACSHVRRYLSAPTVRFPFNDALRGGKTGAWTSVPFEGIQGIRRAAGGTVNDVFTSILLGALERYARLHGIDTGGRHCLIQVPASVRLTQRPADLGNHVSSIPVILPFGEHDPVARLRTVQQTMIEVKSMNLAWGMHSYLQTLRKMVTPPGAWLLRKSYLSPIAQRIIHRIRRRPVLHTYASNVAGPPTPIYLAGQRAIAQYPLPPLIHGLGLACTGFSYNGRMNISFTADDVLAPDVNKLAEFVIECYEELARMTGAQEAGPPTPVNALPTIRMDDAESARVD